MKKRLLGLMLIVLCLFFMTGCSNKDLSNSNGTYTINIAGREDQRQESVTIKNTKATLKATVSGSIYYDDSTIYKFDNQEVTIRQYEGALWYGKVKCTDGVERVVFVMRSGDNQVSSVGVDLSAFSCGVGISVPVYNEYRSINYLIYHEYSYLK